MGQPMCGLVGEAFGRETLDSGHTCEASRPNRNEAYRNDTGSKNQSEQKQLAPRS